MSVFTPDDFRQDWYGWLTNQCSHIGLGIFIAWAASAAVFAVADEFPFKDGLWWSVCVLYLLYEIVCQRWQRWDTLEDAIFVVGYGTGGALAAFSEMVPGSGDLVMSIWSPLPFFLVAAAHLVVGVALRVSGGRHGRE